MDFKGQKDAAAVGDEAKIGNPSLWRVRDLVRIKETGLVVRIDSIAKPECAPDLRDQPAGAS